MTIYVAYGYNFKESVWMVLKHKISSNKEKLMSDNSAITASGEKNMLELIIIVFIRFVVSFILLSIAVRSFLLTKSSAMFYVSAGFALITFGDVFSDLYFFGNVYMDKLSSNLFDLIGLTAIIIALIQLKIKNN